MNECVVSVKGFQSDTDSKDSIEMKAVGQFEFFGDKALITYYENQTIGQDVKVIIEYLTNGKLSIMRNGALQNDMIIEKGKRNCSPYSTTQGKLIIGVYGKSIFADLNKDGGVIFAEYDLDIEGGFISRNRIEITVKEV